MNKDFVEQTGARFFEMASSLGRMNVDALSTLATATEKTPLGAIFAANAKIAKLAQDNVEAMVAPYVGKTADTVEAPKPAKAKAPKKAAAAPVKQAKPAPKVADVEAHEPAIDDLLVEEAPAKAAADSPADDLTQITGIGATTMRKLNDVGVSRFADIAAMSEDRFKDLLASLSIKSIRYTPDFWIAEAKKHAA